MFIRTYGEPGGLWLAYTLDFERDTYAVVNEGGDTVYESGSEQDCIDYCESHTC